MLILIRAFILACLTFASGAQGVELPAAKGPLTLGTVDGEANDTASFVNIRFNRKPDFEKVSVSAHGSFIQIDLPGTLVPNPGAFVDGNSPYVKKIAIFQLTNSDGAVRLFVTKSAATVQKAMRAEILGNRILVTIDHKGLTELVAAAAKPGPQKPAPENELLATKAAKPITPADVMHGKATLEEAGFATGGIDFRDKLVKVAAFIGALLFFATILMMLRPFIKRRNRRKGKAGNSEPAFGMSTIASMPLAAKQKLSLIQVGNEKILIAIGPESVTYIATIGASNQPQMAMAAAMQQAFAFPSLPGGQHYAPAAPASIPATPQRSPEPQPSRLRIGAETTEKQAAFDSALAAADPDAQHIKLKANPLATFEDDDAAAKPTTKKKKKQPSPEKRSGGRVNIAIGDDGVTDFGTKERSGQKTKTPDPRTIDDVTQLIRQKLQAFKSL